MDIGEAVESMQTECIRNDILGFLANREPGEVIAMSVFEYNEEEEIEKNP